MQIWLWLIPVLLALGHYLGKRLRKYTKWELQYFRSFTAGFTIAYVFLLLLPEVERSPLMSNTAVMFFVMLGFVLFHVILKTAFRQREASKKYMFSDFFHLLSVGTFNFLIAFTVVQLILQDFDSGVGVFSLVVLHALLSEMSEADVHPTPVDRWKLPLVIALIFLGALLSLSQVLPAVLITTLFAITVGSIIYVAIREEVPHADEGKPVFFLLGSTIFTFIFFILI